MEELKILVLDDEQRLRDELGEYLQKRKHEVFLCANPTEAFGVFLKTEIDIAILDIRLPEMSGLEVLRQIKDKYPATEVIMISGHGDMESVIEAMRSGAFDYFQKPFRMNDVQHAIEKTQKFIELSKKLRQKENAISVLTGRLYEDIGSPMIGQSKAINDVIQLMSRVALSEQTNVLITGESGTGKELVAHGIHLLSSRKDHVFHSVNCSAITDSLFESEFFGHKKGSFTGAFEDRAGSFELAHNGTLFLDEVGDMPLGQQAKLLRTLEDRKVRPVGAKAERIVDVRVISASNQYLTEMIDEKKFRHDLYHRLSTFIIHLPPLRDRKEDIPLLVDYFIKLFSKRMNKTNIILSDEALLAIQAYSFPGNIRELRNLVERAVILMDGKLLLPKHFPLVETSGSLSKNKGNTGESFLDEKEKQAIIQALKKFNNNKTKAAEALNITWQSLNRRMKKYGID